MDWLILSLSLLIFNFVYLVDTQSIYNTGYQNTVLFGAKTSYKMAKDLFREYLVKTHRSEKENGSTARHKFGDNNQHPTQCTPKQLSILFRHGTRYPSRGDIARIAKLTDKIQEMELIDRFGHIRNWNNIFTSDKSSKLSDSGAKELTSIASRYVGRFIELFSQSMAESSRFELISSDTERTQSSAEAFIKGLEDKLSVDPNTIKSKLSLRNDLIRFYESCSRYLYSVDSDYARDHSMAEFEMFKLGSEMEQVAKRVSARVSPTGDGTLFAAGDMRTIWLLCGFEKAIHGQDYDSPWCQFITPEDSSVLEYAFDLKAYWKKSYGYTINYEQSCPLLTDIFQNFQEIVTVDSAPGVSLYFGHSETINPIYSLLGLFLDDTPLAASNFLHHRDNRKFRGSAIGSFAANIGFVLYECEEGAQSTHPDWPEQLDRHMLQIMVNEHAIPLPFTDKLAVGLHEFEDQYYQHVHHCDFNQLCHNNPEATSSPHEEL